MFSLQRLLWFSSVAEEEQSHDPAPALLVQCCWQQSSAVRLNCAQPQLRMWFCWCLFPCRFTGLKLIPVCLHVLKWCFKLQHRSTLGAMFRSTQKTCPRVGKSSSLAFKVRGSSFASAISFIYKLIYIIIRNMHIETVSKQKTCNSLNKNIGEKIFASWGLLLLWGQLFFSAKHPWWLLQY